MIRSLVPTVSNAEDVISLLVQMVSKHKASIQTMLDGDAFTMEKSDMTYFDKSWWGKIPTYAQFMRTLKKVNPELEEELRYMEAEALGGMYERGMQQIMNKSTSDFDGSEGKRFNWGEKMYKMQERKMDRLDRHRKDKGLEEGVDLAVRVINAMSNSDLMRAKKVMEAEWKEVSDE